MLGRSTKARKTPQRGRGARFSDNYARPSVITRRFSASWVLLNTSRSDIALFALSVYAIITFLPTAVKPLIPAKLLISSIPSGQRLRLTVKTGRLTDAELDGYTIGHQHVIQVSLKGYETRKGHHS